MACNKELVVSVCSGFPTVRCFHQSALWLIRPPAICDTEPLAKRSIQHHSHARMLRFQKEMTQARLELATFRVGHCECEANVITNYTIEPDLMNVEKLILYINYNKLHHERRP